MKIGFITSIRPDHLLPKEKDFKRFSSSVGLLSLIAVLEEKSPDLELRIHDELDDFEDFQPDILAISSVTENFEYAKHLAKKAKLRWGATTLIGGVHISSIPHVLPEEFDFGFVGEGELVLYNFLTKLEKEGESYFEKHDLAGLISRRRDQVYVHPRAQAIDPLDDLPLIKREKFVEEIAVPYIMSSRGCPYTCSFCVIPALGGGYRVHSPSYVVQDIQNIKNHFPEVRNIRFFDDLFITQKKRVAELANLLSKEGLNEGLSYSCWGRANLFDDEMIDALKKMNMKYVAFGAESGSSSLMSKVKPGSSTDLNQAAIHILQKNDIRVIASVILGHPDETEEDLLETLAFVKKNEKNFNQVEFNVALPWPGTDIWNYAKSVGLVADDMDFSSIREAGHFPNYNTSDFPYLNKHMSPERFMTILDEFKEIYENIHSSASFFEAQEELGACGNQARYYK